MRKLLTKLFGDPNEAPLKPFQQVVAQVNALEPQMEALSDLELRELANGFRDRLEDGESLDALLPESFAATREAGRRALGQRHYDVQLMGGIVLHQGKIAEMRTGEGKTLTATLAVALNALSGQGVHVVTVNDYLAKRDTQWMGQIYDALGLSVACIQHDAAFIYDPDWVSEDERLARSAPDLAARGVRGRYHLRHEQRVRVRLPARQHGADGRPDGAARPGLRDRRRGRQHPDRRGAHAADHLRPGRARHRPLLPVRPDREATARRARLRGRPQAQDRSR